MDAKVQILKSICRDQLKNNTNDVLKMNKNNKVNLRLFLSNGQENNER